MNNRKDKKSIKVAFVGHRKVENKREVKERVAATVEKLIQKENADTFYFGSKSEFNDICYEAVTELKSTYTHIRRVFVRAEYETIDESYTKYLATFYEETFYPTQVHGAGALSYIKRNQVMTDMCDILIIYCDTERAAQTNSKSGTVLAAEYAVKKKKRVINVRQ